MRGKSSKWYIQEELSLQGSARMQGRIWNCFIYPSLEMQVSHPNWKLAVSLFVLNLMIFPGNENALGREMTITFKADVSCLMHKQKRIQL